VAESGDFTDFVRAVAEGERLDETDFNALWKALGTALRGELKKRGLWESPPSYLGVFGWGSWEPAGSWQGRESALEELLAECYSYIFVDRLRSLQAQLKVKPNIDGLVFLNIRHFLHERQKEHDPIGSQVFETLQAAVRMAVEERELEVTGGDERIRNDTVLAFRRGVELQTRDREKLPSLVAAWNDELLPDLITLRGRRQEEVVRRLRTRLPDLRAEGIEAFRFKDVVDPLKADVRARWASLLDRAQGELAPQAEEDSRGEAVRLVQPDLRVEERQVFRKLVDCVLAGVRRLDVSERTRGYLTTLWQFLRIQASDGVEATPGSLDAALVAEIDDEPLSQRKLAEQLQIPRERLSGLYDTLRDLLSKCQAAISGKSAVISLKGDFTLGDRRRRPDDH
jgi:uncharacterized protein YicC (UPF0701 family)